MILITTIFVVQESFDLTDPPDVVADFGRPVFEYVPYLAVKGHDLAEVEAPRGDGAVGVALGLLQG